MSCEVYPQETNVRINVNNPDLANPPPDNDNDEGSICYKNLTERPNEPIGVTLFGKFCKFDNILARRTFHKALMLCITFISYSCLHMGRRPLSIVKNILNQNCSVTISSVDPTEEALYFPDYDQTQTTKTLLYSASENCTSWAPFDDDSNANQLLALLDSAFLFSYAFFMFFSGYIADHCNLRYFLSGGLLLSGILLYAFGLAYYLDIHSMSYFVTVQILSGIVQTAGWPTVVACIGNWFDHTSRGAIFGIWNANTNIGNILGATIAGYFVERAWGLSFIVPGFILLLSAVLVFLFLVPRPEDVHLLPIKSTGDLKSDSAVDHDCDIEATGDSTVIRVSNDRTTSRRKLHRNSRTESNQDNEIEPSIGSNDEQSPLINQSCDDVLISQPISFWSCLKIPGVVEYSLSLGFAKLVSYTFLYWLPRYITQSTQNNSEQSAYLSVPFDIGGIVGAIVAGYFSDRTKKSATICSLMLLFAIPSMFVYEELASISNSYNICLQLITGSLVNGPYALITTAVSADLGSRVKNGKAMATVAAIIDGTGSIGAAAGPLFAGYIADSGWQSVFMMLMASDLIAVLCLTRVTLKELTQFNI